MNIKLNKIQSFKYLYIIIQKVVRYMSGVEPSFGMNAFNKAKYKNETETIANSILSLLFGRPGYFPSMPNLGIDIQSLLYSFWDEIDTEVIKMQIVSQCTAFREYIDDGSLDVIKSSYAGQPLLLIVIPVQTKNGRESLSIGITQDANGNAVYNYVFDETTS
jgi:hypothetical protein